MHVLLFHMTKQRGFSNIELIYTKSHLAIMTAHFLPLIFLFLQNILCQLTEPYRRQKYHHTLYEYVNLFLDYIYLFLVFSLSINYIWKNEIRKTVIIKQPAELKLMT